VQTTAKQWVRAAILAGLVASLAACATTPYRRSLPGWVQRVHVPMVLNHTTEPGLEERFTDTVTREILADGRLDVVPEGQCDAVLRVTVKSYKTLSAGFSSDETETLREVNVVLSLGLYDPTDPKTALGEAKDFTVSFRYYPDYRGLTSLTREDAMDRLSTVVGRTVVQQLMSNVEMTRP
jgi:hypothetical protein